MRNNVVKGYYIITNGQSLVESNCNLSIYIVCSPPLGSGGGTIFGKIFPRGGNIIFEEAGGTTSGGEYRFPNHLGEELRKNQKLIHETLFFKQFRAIFRSK